ncbi:MAG: NHL repeat-containing protein [Thermoleophilia bacterium]
MIWQNYKGRLIILGILVVALAVVGLLLSHRLVNTPKAIAGTSFNLAFTIYDLRTPLGVTADSNDNVYVADTGNSMIKVYDRNGNFQYRLDSVHDDKGNRTISFPSPYGLAIDNSTGKLYVCDYSVYVLDKSGKYLDELTIPAGVVKPDPNDKSRMRPNQVAILNDRVYVTSRDGIYIWDKNTDQFVTHWGTRGTGLGQYDYPNGIAADPTTGNIYVADTNNWRLVCLGEDGKIRWTLGRQQKGNIPSPWHLIRSVSVDKNGNVFISDSPDRIVVLDKNGKLISIIGERGTEETKLNFPEGVFVSAMDRLYIADRENDRVQAWQLNSQLPRPSSADVDKFAKALSPATQ